MRYNGYLIFILMFGFFFGSRAQERWPINVYNPKDYKGESQNWSISQSQDHYIYLANNKGLLEFNGANWNLYKSPNETIIRAVKVIDTLIYTGSYHEFGYWLKDDFGVLNYTSLSKTLEVEFLEDEEVWNIKSLDHWILFQSLNRIYIYNKGTHTYSVINSKTSISRVFQVDETFYFQNLNNGLYKIENGTGVLLSDDDIVKNNRIVNIYSYNKSLIILTQDNGFYELHNDAMRVWDIPANNNIKKVSVFSSIQLKDKSYVLGTISDGIFHLTSDGVLDYKINQSNGLSNNTVLSLYEDDSNNIWLGLDNGINCINIESPYQIYFDKNGVIGTVYTSKVYDGCLYLGTNQGLFYKTLNKNEDFKFVEGTQGQVWCLESIGNVLFCGHNSGTFEIKNKKAKKIVNVQGTWKIIKVNNHKNLLLQGNYNGLNILEKINGHWQFRNTLKGFNVSSRYCEFLNDNTIYVNHEYKGLFRLKVDKDLTRVTKVTKDTTVEKGLYSSLVKYNKDILYTSKKGVFKYNSKIKTFQKDTLLSKLVSKQEFISGKLVSDYNANKLWGFTSKGINYLTTSKFSGEKKINTIPFPVVLRKEKVGFENISHIRENQFMFGSTTGYIIIDLNKIVESNTYTVKLNQIKVGEFKDKGTMNLVNLNSKSEFDNKDNTIQFSYSIPEFLETQNQEYQYKLKGAYKSWSSWSTNSSVLFENLPYGDYTFTVQGRVGDDITINAASYSFKIKRPWFLSNLAIGLYTLAILLFSFMMHHIYKRYYRKQRERLMLKTTREFELKALSNKQELMRLKNEKLREDIESKNRELGISTMNLIKKNEFLNTIKKELEHVNHGNNLKNVIKIIDKNLNNTDDWNLFQEAFNNADKDFLKKMKSLHPTLTSNDLRLCAYLRLNLSSKEIAPLLNISSRSVEVKRYRLRKKIDLPHESSLSNYILEI